MTRCTGTRHCDATPSRACNRCERGLCSRHWTETTCGPGGHRDDAGKAESPKPRAAKVAWTWERSGGKRGAAPDLERRALAAKLYGELQNWRLVGEAMGISLGVARELGLKGGAVSSSRGSHGDLARQDQALAAYRRLGTWVKAGAELGISDSAARILGNKARAREQAQRESA